jgi:hypothetical protein
MAEPSSSSMAALFSDLIGRRVTFSEQLNALPANGKQIVTESSKQTCRCLAPSQVP